MCIYTFIYIFSSLGDNKTKQHLFPAQSFTSSVSRKQSNTQKKRESFVMIKHRWTHEPIVVFKGELATYTVKRRRVGKIP